MKKFNGIELDRKSKEWKAFKSLFPNSKSKELSLKFENGFESVFKSQNEDIDESFWLCPIKDLIEGLGWSVEALCAKIFGRYSNQLVEAVGSLYFIGTEDCESCGGATEFYDHGEIQCIVCKEVFDSDTTPEKYYDPRMD